jgi:outer membrane lipoprotein-sorting protein
MSGRYASLPRGVVGRRQLLAGAAITMLAGCVTTPPLTELSGADTVRRDQIAACLNGLHRLRARFFQSGAAGGASGTLWIDRPGLARIQYDPPDGRVILAARGRLSLTDPASGASSTMPLSRTPLGLLLADPISLTDGVTVTGLRAGEDGTQITLTRAGAVWQGSITLYFGQPQLSLTGLDLLDSHGQRTALRLYDVVENPDVDARLFS